MPKITAYTEDTAPVSTDLFVMVEDPAGTPVTKKVTVATITKTFPDNSKYIMYGGYI